MENFKNINMSEDEFVERYLNEMNAADAGLLPINVTLSDCIDVVEVEHADGSGVIKKPKLKRRANLTEFDESQTVRRKNESAKRELTSIVNQLGKIDKQLNGNEEEPRASITFIATFTSFKSNRLSTFKYPPDAVIKPNFLDYDATISAVKLAVKEAVSDLLPGKDADTTVSSPNQTAASITPTKAISAFTALPSPVAARKALPTMSKNLCGKNSCSFGKKFKKPVWVKCSHSSDDGQSCMYWVHAPCIGFPHLKEADVKMLDGWFCPDHTELQMKRK